jgi:hypothetical protein
LGYGIPPPDPGQYSGRPAREYLRDLTFWLRGVLKWLDRNRAVDAGDGSAFLIKTTGTITARSGTTPGSGSAQVVTGTSSSLSTGATITLYNWAGASIATGKYGTAASIGGLSWVVSIEC